MKLRKWKMYALIEHEHTSKTEFFAYIGDKGYVQMYYKAFDGDLPMVPVLVKEDKKGEYYGWIDTNATNPEMIWKRKNIFEMCFTYGSDAEVKAGRGEVIRLSIKKTNKSLDTH
jgi:hypothetical protein